MIDKASAFDHREGVSSKWEGVSIKGKMYDYGCSASRIIQMSGS
jgi:hypothetical protein